MVFSKNKNRMKIVGYDKPVFQGILYIISALFTGILTIFTIDRYLDESDLSFLLVFILLFGVLSTILLFYAFKGFFNENQILRDEQFLIHRKNLAKSEDEDKFDINRIKELVISQEVRSVYNFVFFSWVSTEKIWTLGLRMEDNEKYWIIQGKRVLIQEIAQSIAEAIHKSIQPEKDKDIPGKEAYL